jgi:glycosyltransferase involved in cell wall biosynthesis
MIPAMAAPGGAERTMSYLVSHFAQRHEVTLLTLESPEAAAFWPLPSAVESVGIDKLGGKGLRRLARVLVRPGRIRQEIQARSPDVVVSFMDTMNVTALISCLRLDVPVIVSERNDPALHHIGRAKELLRDRAYQLAHIVVVQTERIARYFTPRLQAKLRIIPNPVPQFPNCAAPQRSGANGRFRMIGVSRLEPHKGFDRLIQAFAEVAQAHPDWDLRILGEGRQRAELEALISARHMDGRVQLPGIVRDVIGELCSAHAMAFPSRYEGFPNALAEGLALGLPAVGLRGVSGVEDLIVHGKTGFLVSEDCGAMAEALSRLMRDAAIRKQCGDAARHHMRQWAPSKILALWDAVLYEAVNEAPARAGAAAEEFSL